MCSKTFDEIKRRQRRKKTDQTMSFEMENAVTNPKSGCRIRFTFGQSFIQVLFILMNKYWTANSSTFCFLFIPYAQRQIDSDVILWDDFI